MTGQDLLDGYVFGAVTVSTAFLSCYLFGPTIAIIFMATIALGIALSLTPSPKPKPARSRKTQPLSPSSHSRLASEAATVLKKPAYTRRDAVAIPDSPVWFQPRQKKRSKHLEAVQQSLNFEEDSWPSNPTNGSSASTTREN